MKKLILAALIVCSFTPVKAQSDFSEFEKGKIGYGINLGFQTGLGGINGFGSALSLGVYGCYDLADWSRFYIGADYLGNIGLNSFVHTDFVINHFVRVPVLAMFKVGDGSIGAGMMQNIFIASNKIKRPEYDYSLNETYAVIELNNIIFNCGIRLGYQMNQSSLVYHGEDYVNNIEVARRLFVEVVYHFDLSDFFGNYKSREKAANARKRK